MANAISAIFWVLCIICVLGLIGVIINYQFTNYEYESKVGAYFENARDCISPECILEQLIVGKEEMSQVGLTSSDYGAMFFKKPDNSMKFQMQHLDAIIDRVESVNEWKSKTYGNNTQFVETMKDVYSEKMNNLRNYIHEGGRSDWIAHDAWLVKYHPFAYLADTIGIILVILAFVFGIIGGATWSEY